MAMIHRQIFQVKFTATKIKWTKDLSVLVYNYRAISLLFILLKLSTIIVFFSLVTTFDPSLQIGIKAVNVSWFSLLLFIGLKHLSTEAVLSSSRNQFSKQDLSHAYKGMCHIGQDSVQTAVAGRHLAVSSWNIIKSLLH